MLIIGAMIIINHPHTTVFMVFNDYWNEHFINNPDKPTFSYTVVNLAGTEMYQVIAR